MKLYCLLAICALSVLTSNVMAQNDSTILTIGDEKFSKSEFNFIYNKNNQVAENKKSPDEYLQLFVNYKLKVYEAQQQGLDTLPSFKNELAYYKDELQKPYLTDKAVTEELLQEAYNHQIYEVDASHILVLVPRNPMPADTLKAYQKITDILQKFKAGGDFGQLASQYSEDPSAVSNAGRLGYFSGFMMVYPFEKAAYNTAVGEVSPIVKTQFGYHLIYVHGIRKSRGEIKVAHIMRIFPRNSSQEVIDQVKLSIDSIYTKLQNGAKFEDLASQYSEDGNSARKGGEMPWFGTGRMIPEFADPAFALKANGDISQPIQTPFGWHIIKRLDLKDVKSFEELKPELESKIANDERAYSGQNAVVEHLKREYNLKVNTQNFDLLSEMVIKPSVSDSAFYAGNTNNSNILFTFADQKITVDAFKKYLQGEKKYLLQYGYQPYKEAFDEFQKSSILNYEKGLLASKYDSYRFLLNEYHDGLLIFDISKKEVWDKASADTIGLKSFYAQNPSKYVSALRFEGRVFACQNKAVLAEMKKFKNAPKQTLDSVIGKLNATDKVVQFFHGTFVKGDNWLVDQKKFKVKEAKSEDSAKFPYSLLVGEMKQPAALTFDEAKGQIISDYQNYLDQEWIKNLREKYKPLVGTL